MSAEKIEAYNKDKKNIQVTPAKYTHEFEWLKEVDSLALANAQLHLQSAFTNFFRNPSKVGFPKYKAKYKGKNAYTTNCVNGNIRIDADRGILHLPKVGDVKCAFHRSIDDTYTLKSVTISREPSGEYYASILFEYDELYIAKEIDEANVIGLDFSMHEGYIDSNGNSCEYPRYFRLQEKKLSKEQRVLA